MASAHNLPTLKQLKYFIALSESLNFTLAAQACFVGQSTLSAGLKELEDVLGVQLVERDRQHVTLTAVGLEVLARAKSMVTAGEDLMDHVSMIADSRSGYLRLGVIPTIAPFVLPTLLPDMRQVLPNLKVLLREDLTHHLLAKVRNHTLDFALIALPFPTEGLLIKNLFEDPFSLIGLPNESAFQNSNITLTKQVTDQVLLLEEGHCLREHALLACKRSEIQNTQGAEATSLLTLVQMVESGLGLALLPKMAIEAGFLHNTNLISKPLRAPAPSRMITLVARQTTSRIDVFNDLVHLLHKDA